ncbi:MAG TPA: HAD-IA family hydrolase [Anaerolineaceae bacterium]|nr:HAD-IA family hydrolase [Anaerolineaceae bacterium]
MNKALIFDCDGVLADTERYGHLPAFNQTFREFNLPVQWSEEEYGVKLKIAGGKERMASLLTPEFVTQAGLPTDPEEQKKMIADWHKRKTETYKQMTNEGRLPGRPGVRRVVQEAKDAGWALAVASTSAEESVRAVLEFVVGKELAASFLVLAGDIVPRKKPAPDIYLLTLEKLGLPVENCLIVEDSRNGLLAAVATGVRCVVTLSSYTWDENMDDAVLVVSDLGEPDCPMQVVANRSKARPGEYITLRDLETCLES